MALTEVYKARIVVVLLAGAAIASTACVSPTRRRDLHRGSEGSGFSHEGPWRHGKIAFCSYRDGNPEVYVMNPDGSGQTNVTNSPGYDGNPCWSPDGRKIAFRSARDGNYEIYVMNSDGSGQKRLTHSPLNDSDPCWSPDGKSIAFVEILTGD